MHKKIVPSIILFVLSLVLFCTTSTKAQKHQIKINTEKKAEFRFTKFSQSGEYFVTSEDLPKSHIKFWDASSFQLLHTLPFENQKVEELAISADGRFVAICFKKNEIEIWDTKLKKNIVSFQSIMEASDMAFHPTKPILAISGYYMQTNYRYSGFGHVDKKNVIDIINLSKAPTTGKVFGHKLNYDGVQCHAITYSPDGKYLVGTNSTQGEKNIIVWSTASKGQIYTLRLDNNRSFLKAKFIPNTNLLVYNTAKQYHVVDFIKKKEVFSTPVKHTSSSGFDINQNGEIIYKTNDGFEIMDLINKKIRCNIKQNDLWLTQLHPKNGLAFITTSRDQKIIIWDYKKQKHLATLASTDTPDGYLISNPEGYYYGSKSGVKALEIIKDNQVFSYESFDLEFNRPDKILSAFPNVDSKLIRRFEDLVKNRNTLMEQAVTENPINQEKDLPQVQFLSAMDQKVIQQQKGKVSLSIKMFDLKTELSHLVVSINKVPVYQKSLNGAKMITEVIPVQLSHGENLIEAFVENQKGVRSLTKQITGKYQKQEHKQKLFFAGVGISDYQQLKDLSFAHKDILDLSKFLKSNTPSSIEVKTKTLINQQATQSAILDLASELRQTNIDDIVILYLAGHGKKPSLTTEWHFAPHDYQNSQQGITDKMLNDLIQQSPSRKKIIVLDACYAGEISGNRNLQTRIVDINGNTRGADEDDDDDESKDLKPETIDLIKDVFNDLRTTSGTVVIAASGAQEVAIESHGNGAFTYCFLNAFKTIVADTNFDRQLTLSELMAYIHDNIGALSGQQPSFKKKNAGLDFLIWERKKKQVKYDQLFKE